MAGSVNQVILVGRLTRDPELRSTSDGTRIANLNIATSETWRDRNSGERKERSEFHRVVVFNENISKVVEAYLRKGALVYVSGALQTRKWTDQQGVEKYSTEIVLQKFRGELQILDGGKQAEEEGPPARTYAARRNPPQQQREFGAMPSGVHDLDDSIPFITCDPKFEPHRKRRVIL